MSDNGGVSLLLCNPDTWRVIVFEGVIFLLHAPLNLLPLLLHIPLNHIASVLKESVYQTTIKGNFFSIAIITEDCH